MGRSRTPPFHPLAGRHDCFKDGGIMTVVELAYELLLVGVELLDSDSMICPDGRPLEQ